MSHYRIYPLLNQQVKSFIVEHPMDVHEGFDNNDDLVVLKNNDITIIIVDYNDDDIITFNIVINGKLVADGFECNASSINCVLLKYLNFKYDFSQQGSSVKVYNKTITTHDAICVFVTELQDQYGQLLNI